MSKTYIHGAALEIRRPGGEIEVVINTTHAVAGVIAPATFAAMVKATKAAGRGDILGQRPNVVPMPLAAQRTDLEARANAGDAFPGSAQWRAARAAEAELAAFDAEHPEIAAAAYVVRNPAAVERALRGED